MEDAVSTLETKFSKANSSLTTLETRLELSMASSDDADQKQRAQVIERVKEIRRSYNEIVKEADQLRQATQDTMTFFKEQIGVACSVMGKLGEAAGAPPGQAPDTSEEMRILRENFGVEFGESSTTDSVANVQDK